MMRVQCRTTTGVQAAAGHRRADEQGKQPEDSASARKHGLTAGQSPDAVQKQIKPKINALFDSFRLDGDAFKIGRAHALTPVTNAQLVCRLLLVKKNKHKKRK